MSRTYQDELILKDITTAAEHAREALNVVYEGNSPIRKWWWRRRLLKAESLLMGLMLEEERHD